MFLVYNVLLMDRRQNMWSPWYLMPKDKLVKVECKFCDNVISYCKDRMLFHLGYQNDGNGWIGVAMCSKAHLGVKAMFSQCGGPVLPPLNDMEVPTHIPNGRIEDVAIETFMGVWNLSVEREFALTFQMEGVQIFTPFQITHKVLIDPQITTLQSFDKFPCPRIWIQLENKIWTRNGQFYFMRQTSPSMLCDIWCSLKLWKKPLNLEHIINTHHTMDCTQIC
jgi:hypothetical protein